METAAVLGTRCAAVIAKVTPVTCPPNIPESTAVLALSKVDWTVTREMHPVDVNGAPVATLLNVHTLAVVSHAVVVVVRMNCVALPATVAVRPVPPVQTTVGVVAVKKFEGKLMVIWFAAAAA